MVFGEGVMRRKNVFPHLQNEGGGYSQVLQLPLLQSSVEFSYSLQFISAEVQSYTRVAPPWLVPNLLEVLLCVILPKLQLIYIVF